MHLKTIGVDLETPDLPFLDKENEQVYLKYLLRFISFFFLFWTIHWRNFEEQIQTDTYFDNVNTTVTLMYYALLLVNILQKNIY